jgi:lysylphosphatidylglycerol synthetase-like protein (DUF2156 family)
MSNTVGAKSLVSDEPLLDLSELGPAALTTAGALVILVRLFVISDGNPAIAVNIAGSAGFFSLMLALTIDVFAVVLASAAGGLLLVGARSVLSRRVPGQWYAVATVSSLLLVILMVPGVYTNYVAVTLAALVLLLSVVYAKRQSRLLGWIVRGLFTLAAVAVLAFPIREVFFENDPWGQAQTFSISATISESDTSGDTSASSETIVGFVLEEEGPQTVILSYRPRLVLTVPTASIQRATACAVDHSERRSIIARQLASQRDNPVTAVPPCFDS